MVFLVRHGCNEGGNSKGRPGTTGLGKERLLSMNHRQHSEVEYCLVYKYHIIDINTYPLLDDLKITRGKV